MERRLTAFLLPLMAALLIFAVILDPGEKGGDRDESAPPRTVISPEVGQGGENATGQSPSGQDPAAKDPGAGETTVFGHRFGAMGERGSLWFEFDRRGGAIWEGRLLDEPADATAYETPAAERTVEECYAAVKPVESGLVSLALDTTDASKRDLGVNLYQDTWDVKVVEDEVTFTLKDAKTGLTFERVYARDPEWRGLTMALRVRAGPRPEGVELPRELQLSLYGFSLINPKTDHFFQNPAIGIGVTRYADDLKTEFVRGGEEVKGPIAKKDNRYDVCFAGSTNRFFGAFLLPDSDTARYAMWQADVEQWPRRTALVDHDPSSVPVTNYRLRLSVPDPGETTDLAFRLYLGPKSSGVFSEDPRYEVFDQVMDVDLSPYCFCPIPGAMTMARLLLWLLRSLEGLVSSWGVAIIIMTLMVRGSLVPLNFRMQKSMRKFGAKMARLKPEMDAIKKRNESDPKKMQQELAAFQREHKLIPPLGGCLPLLITFPVFIGLFTGLRVAYELRLQPFMWWNDLSQPDALFQTGLDFLPTFNVLPLLMVVLWFVLQMGTPLPSDPQQRQMMKIMRFMPLMFGVMLYNYASGLMVYMITSSMFGIAEQRVTKKILGPPPDTGMAPVAPAF